ncbi:MAG: hypothetical protein IFK94_04260 [Acidobacteria bacterium]|uniref:Uncharacterized protein n=1 Tax=Candidatus Polarisedimenticola svalbardensis TaxID=2886004 RepID=A0A8J7C1F9_9BACT|nr:hypothetical protein [Candidatus Polarisedimenticola svalbardensis]
MNGTRILGMLLALAVPIPIAMPAQDEKPRSIDMLERTGSRLAQLDVSVTGPKGFVDDLTAADFELRVGGKFIDSFIVDRVCGDSPVATPTLDSTETGDTPPIPISRRSMATYIFFFDQPHLTQAGRQESIDLAHELIPDLMDGNAQAMIVSGARKLEVIQEMTSDPVELAAGLDRLQRNRNQWSTWAVEEDKRIQELLYALWEEKNTDHAISIARLHQRAEIWEAEKSLHRVNMVMGRLAEMDPPKAFLYFADTMRKNPGEHYLTYFGNRMLRDQNFAGSSLSTSAMMAGNAMDRIINSASALGIRFYTVQGEGLVSESMVTAWSGSQADAGRPNLVRVRDAQDTLVGLARETGGAWFLNGVRAEKIVSRIHDDLSCLYLVSFPPGDFPEDTPLPVRLTTSRKKVRIQTRGRLVIQSESARRTARLLSTFATAPAGAADLRISGVVVPTGYENGLFSALVQVTVPGSRVRGATWDLGASLVTEEKVRDDASGRLLAATPGIRVVFEEEMKFPPGPFELVAVGHEITTDQVVSRKLEGNWPNPNKLPVTLSPIVVLQPEIAAFLRNGILREDGPLGYREQEPVDTTRPTAMVGLVCRSKNNRNDLTVLRTLSGDTEAEFPPLQFDAGGDRCVQYRDMVPPDLMTDGEFRFLVTVLEKGEIIATTERTFAAVGNGTEVSERRSDEP